MLTTEELERRSAVSRYDSGEKASAICRSLGRPRKWLYKWVARSRSGDTDWYVDDSRRPKHSPTATPAETVSQIVSAREILEKTPYACRGVFAIRQELRDEIVALPSDVTINRIISREGLIKKTVRKEKVGTAYPGPSVDTTNAVHQMDLWGPRYLGAGKSCYVMNIIDVARRMPSIHPVADKSFACLIPAMVHCWQTLGIPVILQMDNGIAAGTSLHPGSICKIIRLCLHVGIHVLFVPFAEPWRQGVVEKFNDFYARSFFCTHRFGDLLELREHSSNFQDHCWNVRRVSALKGKTPAQVTDRARLRLLPRGFAVDPGKLGIPQGKISFIRMVRSDFVVDVLGCKFPIDERYYREYVTASLCTRSGVLTINHQSDPIAEFQFSMC